LALSFLGWLLSVVVGRREVLRLRLPWNPTFCANDAQTWGTQHLPSRFRKARATECFPSVAPGSSGCPVQALRTREKAGTSANYLAVALEHSHRDEAGDDGGEQRADHKQQLAVAAPELSKSGGLRKNVDDVGCAIGHVGDHRQQEEA